MSNLTAMDYTGHNSSDHFPLLQLPEEIIERIVGYVLGKHIYSRVGDRPLLPSKHTPALCMTHPALYRIARKSVNSLYIHCEASPMNPAIGHVFGPFLRHLFISWTSGPGLGLFFSSLSKVPPALHTLMFDCIRAPFPHAGALMNSANTLEYLELYNSMLPPDLFSGGKALVLPKLTSLSLLHIMDLDHSNLVTLLSASGIRLRRLYLGGLTHNSITDNSLQSVKNLCPNLTYINLGGLFHCTNIGMRNLVSAYGPSLHAAYLTDPRICHEDFKIVASECPNLYHLGLCWNALEDWRGIPRDEEKRLWPRNVRSISLRNKIWNVTKECAANLSLAFTGLRELRMNNIQGDLDEMVVQVCSLLRNQLQVLKVISDFALLSNEGLKAIGTCKSLHSLSLGANYFADGIRGSRFDGVTSDGMDNMLSRVGPKLRVFQWKTPKGDDSESESRFVVLNLIGADLARSLRTYCKNLRYACIVGLQDSVRGTSDSDEQYFQEFEKLVNDIPQLELYLEMPFPNYLLMDWAPYQK